MRGDKGKPRQGYKELVALRRRRRRTFFTRPEKGHDILQSVLLHAFMLIIRSQHKIKRRRKRKGR